MKPPLKLKITASFLLAVLPMACLFMWAGCRTAPRVDYTDPVLNQRRILLFGPIDQQAAELAIQKLLFLDSKNHDSIDLFLQTPGGELKSGMAIEQVMRVIRSPVNTYALSECNSGGAYLLAAGTGKRRAFRGALIMVHGISSHDNPPQDFVKVLCEGYDDFWRKHTRLPEVWFPISSGADHFLSAEQALKYGLVDELVDR
jgi:ATP-dependent Clp protease protease subunit